MRTQPSDNLLTETSGNIDFFTTRDGAKLRFLRAAPDTGSPVRGTLLVLQGRASFLEKYRELVHESVEQGFITWAVDWRGQGGSTRMIDHPQKIYIDHYSTYLSDLDEFLVQKVLPELTSPFCAIASSMGATILLRYLQNYNPPLNGAVLIAPMLHLSNSWIPDGLTGPIVKLLNLCGFEKEYVFGHGDYDPNNDPFESNSSTHDLKRFTDQRKLLRTFPHLLSAGPTFRWLSASLQALYQLSLPENLAKVKTPILVLQAGKDTVVDTRRDRKICSALPNCTLKLYSDAKHGIHVETDNIRDRMWKDILNFFESLV